MITLWAGRWGEPQPYPDDRGIKARMLGMPVGSPDRSPRPGKLKRRASPGDPSCERCRANHRGYCGEHRDFHAEVDPLAGIA